MTFCRRHRVQCGWRSNCVKPHSKTAPWRCANVSSTAPDAAGRQIKLDFVVLVVVVVAGEQLTDEYKKINRLQKVPALVDGDFHLSESVAMIRYVFAPSAKGHLKII